MKTNFKTLALAVALLASVTGAFASDIANAISGKKLAPYNWVKYNRDGSVDTTTPPQVSPTNPFTECSGEEEICAIGTDLANPQADPVIVRYEELP
ncbi:hypothetical protein HDC92_004318 [Pedobacter sp. AK017]|uniref:hypothetical protein n=1 Tax=Pedobacter sp. AK017 TaxID=2723073 RepID=UPI00161FFB58|nr:hypothetical protein [Pedobacter sp. AK017]MBB5440615.1 hypothetical protein [Pedobacter sp. AK017]